MRGGEGREGVPSSFSFFSAGAGAAILGEFGREGVFCMEEEIVIRTRVDLNGVLRERGAGGEAALVETGEIYAKTFKFAWSYEAALFSATRPENTPRAPYHSVFVCSGIHDANTFKEDIGLFYEMKSVVFSQKLLIILHLLGSLVLTLQEASGPVLPHWYRYGFFHSDLPSQSFNTV